MLNPMKSKRMKILFGVLSVFILIVITCIIMFMRIGGTLSSFSEMNYTIDLGTVEDGTYTGSADGTIVKATVRVTVKDHRITDVTILSHEKGKGKPAEAIVGTIVEKNNLEVDAISGATHSSNIIKAAVLDALTK